MPHINVQHEFTKPTTSVIGKSFTIESAHFTCTDSESIRIDGTIIGDITIDGVIVLSETGHIDGDIIAGSIRVAGRVQGNVQCRNAVHLAAAAEVNGNVLAPILIIDEGAAILGTCQTTTDHW